MRSSFLVLLSTVLGIGSLAIAATLPVLPEAAVESRDLATSIAGSDLVSAGLVEARSQAVPASTNKEEGLEKRHGCGRLWGPLRGWCYGSWNQDNWNNYNSQCYSRGWSPSYRYQGSSVYFLWDGTWIIDSQWAYVGTYWLPTFTGYWGFYGPAAWEPRPDWPIDCYNGYLAGAAYQGLDPHYYWDADRNGYWYQWDESFYFETDFIFIQDNAYWVPAQFAW